MKKLLIFMFIMEVFLFGDVKEKYLDYTNKIVYYGFGLKNLDKIQPPFEHKNYFIIKVQKTIKRKNNHIKSLNIKLLSIFNNEALFWIKENIDNNLKINKKWVKINDRIANCRVLKIKLVKVILKCNNKILIKTLNKHLLKMKGIK